MELAFHPFPEVGSKKEHVEFNQGRHFQILVKIKTSLGLNDRFAYIRKFSVVSLIHLYSVRESISSHFARGK